MTWKSTLWKYENIILIFCKIILSLKMLQERDWKDFGQSRKYALNILQHNQNLHKRPICSGISVSKNVSLKTNQGYFVLNRKWRNQFSKSNIIYICNSLKRQFHHVSFFILNSEWFHELKVNTMIKLNLSEKTNMIMIISRYYKISHKTSTLFSEDLFTSDGKKILWIRKILKNSSKVTILSVV